MSVSNTKNKRNTLFLFFLVFDKWFFLFNLTFHFLNLLILLICYLDLIKFKIKLDNQKTKVGSNFFFFLKLTQKYRKINKITNKVEFVEDIFGKNILK